MIFAKLNKYIGNQIIFRLHVNKYLFVLIDYTALKRLVASKPFEGRMISIQWVPQTKKLLLRGLGENISKDLLELQFENERISGGSVENVEMKAAERSAIITFENASSMYEIYNA